MLRFIKRLLENRPVAADKRQAGETELSDACPYRFGDYQVADRYFDTMSRMQAAISDRNYARAAELVHENMQHIPDWVVERRRDHEEFDIRSIPALEQGGTVLALVGDHEGLARMHEIVISVPELDPWTDGVKRHQYDLQLFEAIQDVIATHPKCLQTEIKRLIHEEDGRRVARLLSYLDKAGKIVRVKVDGTYRLLPPGSRDIPTPPRKRMPDSHRTGHKPPLREIDVASLRYVPLPRAPQQWEEAQSRLEQAAVPEMGEYFDVLDADWQIATIDKIPYSKRPDTAFRQTYPTDSGVLVIDDLGKADGLGQIEAAALRYDRTGALAAKKALLHDVYRVGVHPLGCGLIAMSRHCVIHAYNDRLESILETPLVESPEIRAMRKRIEIPDDQIRNHIRCVALSRDASRYLFTAVDEAWCVGMGGEGVWGVKLPIKEGWRRVSIPSSEFGTSAEVDSALALMGLSLPIAPETLKQRYRELAKQWHPDLNPRDYEASEKMKALTAAAEILTGIETNALPHYTGATFVQEIEHTEVEVGGIRFTVSVGMQAGETDVSDWIYAAGFASGSDAVYLAGYSGRIVQVDDKGNGVRVYDIGSVPRRIVDTGDYLYLLTDTRLYVLRGDALHALVDTFEGGDLVVAQTAFGLLEKKRLRWFNKDGQYLGSIISKEPIRRVYATDEGMIIETRQRRAVILGVTNWWESSAELPTR